MIFHTRHFSVPLYIALLCLFTFFTLATAAQDARFVIVIDAGHGGHDPGALGDISKEKDINLAIALELGSIIEQNFKDVKVVFTRKVDEYLTLQERADIVNNNHADLFICVHTNSSKASSATGAESFTLGLAKTKANLDVAMRENSVILLEDNYKSKYKGFDPASVDSYIMFEFMQDKYIDKSLSIASEIQNQFVKYSHRSDRGVRQAGFWVLHRSACPSVLVEVGFISNSGEERYLNSQEGRREMAMGIFNAFVLYKRDHDKKSGKVVGKPSLKPISSPVVPETKAPEVSVTKSSATPIITDVEKQKNGVKAEEKNSTLVVVKLQDSVKTSEKKISVKQLDTIKQKVTTADHLTVAEDDFDKNLPTAPSSSVKKKNSYITPRAKHINLAEIAKDSISDKDLASAKNESLNKKIESKDVSQPKQELKVNKQVQFSVQVLASVKKLKDNSSELKDVDGIDVFEDGGWYKYIVGRTSSHDEAIKIRNKLLCKFPKAFVIGFVNGKKVSEKEALDIITK